MYSPRAALPRSVMRSTSSSGISMWCAALVEQRRGRANTWRQTRRRVTWQADAARAAGAPTRCFAGCAGCAEARGVWRAAKNRRRRTRHAPKLWDRATRASSPSSARRPRAHARSSTHLSGKATTLSMSSVPSSRRIGGGGGWPGGRRDRACERCRGGCEGCRQTGGGSGCTGKAECSCPALRANGRRCWKE